MYSTPLNFFKKQNPINLSDVYIMHSCLLKLMYTRLSSPFMTMICTNVHSVLSHLLYQQHYCAVALKEIQLFAVEQLSAYKMCEFQPCYYYRPLSIIKKMVDSFLIAVWSFQPECEITFFFFLNPSSFFSLQ